jgi:hypothetical protein
VNRIYLVDPAESTLLREQIEPIWTTTTELIVRDGLEPGQWLAVTRLPYAPDGAPVEIIDEKDSEETLAQPTEPVPPSGS